MAGAAAAAGTGDGELFKAGGAQLFIVEGGESVLMQSGRFALTLVKNPGLELAAVVAMVGDVQWPVGRDACVVRDGEASFTFTLPGAFTYNLILEPSTTSTDLQRLEHILEVYSAWQQLPEEQKWLSDRTKKRAADITSPPWMRRMLHARRMSAVAKVFSKSLERGAITAASHVETAHMTLVPPRQQISWSPALASVDAVTRVVEAVETGGRTLLDSVGSGSVAGEPPSEGQKYKQAEADTPSDSSMCSLISSGWTLNKVGLLKLFRVITASMAIHSGGSSGSSSSRSGSSSSSGFRGLLSSSSSSSSFSSKSPATPQSTGSGDVTSTALSLQTPASAGMPSTSIPVPPPPPFFSYPNPARARHSSMPPPSVSPSAMAAPPHATVIASSEAAASTLFHVYKPRPMPAAPARVASSQPAFLARPPRFQRPPKS